MAHTVISKLPDVGTTIFTVMSQLATETGALNLPNVPRQADVREGDLVVTSGLGDRFPGGYPVARVTRIDREQGQAFVRVQAEPLAALDRGIEAAEGSQAASSGQ